MYLIMRKEGKKKIKEVVYESALKYAGFGKQSIGFNEKLLV